MFYESLQRTRQTFFRRVAMLLGAAKLTADIWEEIEALLIQADLGIEVALTVTEVLRKRVRSENLVTREHLIQALKAELLTYLPLTNPVEFDSLPQPTLILVVGANGAGKTTTIAKLARLFSKDGWSVMLAAADTFRAAAIEQLEEWGRRVDVPVVAGQLGGDPGAVIFDAIQAARAQGCNLLLVDTAGRLHTKHNLMEELRKLSHVSGKSLDGAPHEVWLILDGTGGQNALAQARHFKAAVGITGAIVTKLDSTARGGMIFAIGREFSVPVRYVTVGESIDDLLPFDARAFVDSLVE